MGAVFMYFTSGMTFRCHSPTPGQVTCAEGRRLFKLFDVPVRRYTDVRGAVTERRTAYDEDGDTYEKAVTVILTGTGRAEPLPAGEGVGLAGLTERVDDYAKHPTPEGLRMAYDPGYAFFSFHLFAAIFVYAGLWNFGSYFWHLADRLRTRASPKSAPADPEEWWPS
jgi:hypothetical protein